jgi:hypothetical protein
MGFRSTLKKRTAPRYFEPNVYQPSWPSTCGAFTLNMTARCWGAMTLYGGAAAIKVMRPGVPGSMSFAARACSWLTRPQAPWLMRQPVFRRPQRSAEPVSAE